MLRNDPPNGTLVAVVPRTSAMSGTSIDTGGIFGTVEGSLIVTTRPRSGKVGKLRFVGKFIRGQISSRHHPKSVRATLVGRLQDWSGVDKPHDRFVVEIGGKRYKVFRYQLQRTQESSDIERDQAG